MIYTLTLNPAIDVSCLAETFDAGCVNRVSNIRKDPGGKGINVSKTVASLGLKTCACLIKGGNSGGQLCRMLDELKIPYIASEISSGDTRTNVKVTDNHGVTTDINQEGPGFDREAFEELMDRIKGVITPEDIMVLSGKPQPGTPDDIYGSIISELKSLGVRSVLDSSGDYYIQGLKARPFAVKPNAQEAGIACDAEAAARYAKTLADSGIEKVIVSLGDKGAVYCDNSGNLLAADAMKLDIRCVTGCGDSMCAGLAIGISERLSAGKTFALACACASAAAVTDGTKAPDVELIKDYEDNIAVRSLENQILC